MRYELFPQKFTKKHFNLEKITNLLVKFHFDRYFVVVFDRKRSQSGYMAQTEADELFYLTAETCRLMRPTWPKTRKFSNPEKVLKGGG